MGELPEFRPLWRSQWGGYRAIGTRPIEVRKGTIRVISGVGNIEGGGGIPTKQGTMDLAVGLW